jgi:hypothetical protein
VKSKTDNTKWEYPDELDALIAAPGNHKLLFENEHMRVLDTSISPGATTPLHTHRFPASLYIISWADFIRYDAKGNVLLDSRTLEKAPEPSTVLWSDPLPPHTLKNIGDKEIRVLNFEIKKSQG